MGACAVKEPHVQHENADDDALVNGPIDYALIKGSTDPRYDVATVECASAHGHIAWVRVGFLKYLAANGLTMIRRQDCQHEEQKAGQRAHHAAGPLPRLCGRYVVSYPWCSPQHPDPNGIHLKRIVGVLNKDQADNEDAVLIDFMSLHSRPFTTKEEERSFKEGLKYLQFMFMHFRVTMIVSLFMDDPAAAPYFGRCWSNYEFNLGSFSMRLLFPEEDRAEVNEHLTPEWLMDFERKMRTSEFVAVNRKDLEVVIDMRRGFGKAQEHARSSAVGFVAACLTCNFRWVFVSHMRFLAKRGGPAPRRQDLEPGTYVDGLPPLERQRWVVTYPWAAHKHFSPSGQKIRELVKVLNRLKAQDTDVVFLDFTALWQGGHTLPAKYSTDNNLGMSESGGQVTVPEKSAMENKCMSVALYETTRLYAFAGGKLPNGQHVSGCKVIVLPSIEAAKDFPGCDIRPPVIKENHHCTPPRDEEFTDWGFRKRIPYQEGGWTSAEYTIARKNGTIVNSDDKAVKDVEDARKWPEDLAEFKTMMEDVQFTKKGDAEAVRFNFYRYAYHYLE